MASKLSAGQALRQIQAILLAVCSPLLVQAADHPAGRPSGHAPGGVASPLPGRAVAGGRGAPAGQTTPPVWAAPGHGTRLSGRAIDALTGKAIAGAAVVLDEKSSAATTDTEGRFWFRGLPAGDYQVKLIKPGYQAARMGPVALRPGQPTHLEIQLHSRRFQEQIEVEPKEPPPPPGLFPQGISRSEASRVAGSLDDPLRALTLLPGVSTINNQKAELRLRASEPEDTQFSLDGVRLENPYHFRGARGSTSALDLEAFDSLEVTTSGVGAEVGDTVAGTVRLKPSERGTHGRFRETAVGTLTSRFTTGGGLPEGGSWLAAARYSNLDLYRGFIDSNLELSRFADLYLRARQPLAPGLDLIVGGLGSGSRAESLENRGLASTDLAARSSLMYIGVDATPREDLTLTARLSLNDFHQTLEARDIDPLMDDEKRTGLFLTATGTANQRPRWQSGVQAEQIQGSIRGTFDADLSLGPLQAATTRLGAFASLFFYPTERWTVETGFRVDRDARQGTTPALPRVRADYLAADRLTLHLSGGRYAQFPHFEQEFLALDDTLAPTLSDQVSAGATMRLPGGLEMQLNFFVSRLQDITAEVVNRQPDLAEITGRFETGRTRGVELTIRRDRGRFQTQMALTALEARFTRQGMEFRRNADIPYQVDLSGLYLVSNHWEMGGRLQTSAGAPFTASSLSADGQLHAGRLNDGRLPPSVQLDLRATYTHRGSRMKTRYYFEILNILDRQNVTSQVLKRVGQTEEFKVDERSSLPRLPSFGLQMIW